MSSQEIQTTENAAGDLSPAMTPVNQSVIDQMKSYAEAWVHAANIGEQVARTDFAGPFKGKPQDMAVAILKGANLGIPPENIGKAIYVVHGTPSLYGKTALAIALQHGYVAETIEDTPEAVTVRMTSPKGQEMEVRYTIERATKEGLVKGNKVQYDTRPSKMLYWKCVGELTDRMIPHLTGGMPVKEDIEQSEPAMKATATRMDRPADRGVDVVRQALAAKQQLQPDEDAKRVEQAKPSVKVIMQRALDAIAKAETDEKLTSIMDYAAKQGLDQDVLDMLADRCGERAQEVGIV